MTYGNSPTGLPFIMVRQHLHVFLFRGQRDSSVVERRTRNSENLGSYPDEGELSV